MPDPDGENNIISYSHYYKQEKVPFVVYADIECYNVPIHTFQANPESSYTQKHEPSGFCYYIKSPYEEVYKSKKVSYTGKDAAQKFVEMLSKDILEIANLSDRKMIFGKEEKDLYEQATTCWICGGEFTKDNYKVRDHRHFTGRFRGATHNSCNLKTYSQNSCNT